MKQMAFWLALAALVTALGLWPTKAHDASELLPAQVLVVDASRGTVTVKADGGASGSGKSLGEALQDMRAHAPGELFLQTADTLYGNVLQDTALTLNPGEFSKQVGSVYAGNGVTIRSVLKNAYEVVKDDGTSGFVPKSAIQITEQKPSSTQLKKEIASLFANLKGIPADAKREIAFQIRNLSRLNRGLSIMVEILREDIDEYRNKHCFQTIKKR